MWDKILERMRIDNGTLVLVLIGALGAYFFWVLPVPAAEKIASMVIGGLLAAYQRKP